MIRLRSILALSVASLIGSICADSFPIFAFPDPPLPKQVLNQIPQNPLSEGLWGFKIGMNVSEVLNVIRERGYACTDFMHQKKVPCPANQNDFGGWPGLSHSTKISPLHNVILLPHVHLGLIF